MEVDIAIQLAGEISALCITVSSVCYASLFEKQASLTQLSKQNIGFYEERIEKV